MPHTEQQQSTHRFGMFEFNAATGDLRKRGIKLELQQQPRQILGIFLERPGEVVTREELQHALWPADVYLDFDTAINTSVRKLREALGDTADSPRYIETLPRRGYRFIAPVSRESLRFSGIQTGPPVPAPRKRGSRRFWLIALPAVGLTAIAAGIMFWFSGRGGGGATPLLRADPFTSYPGYEELPSFSPDGTRIAFSWWQPNQAWPGVYVKLLGPGEPVRLSGAGFGPVWSPDGRFIAFLRPIDWVSAGVVVVPAMGGQEREITDISAGIDLIGDDTGGGIPAPFLAWSPDGKWLLTLAGKSPGTGPHAIIRVSVDSGEQQILTAPRPNTWGDGGLALSPDSKTLAFAENSGFWAHDIYVVPVSGDLLFKGKPRRITIDRQDIGGLAWTGDGKSLVFSSGRNGKTELWRIRPEPGSSPVRVGLTADDVTDLAISRDGKRLVYARDLEDSNIWRASLKGEHVTGPANLIASMRKDIQARYSPDGKRIVFESNRSGTEEIWICNADGTNAVQLTYFGNAWAGTPTWSPDGNNIAFAADADRTWDIYIVSSAGGKPRRLTGEGADENWPVWSRDGQWIYYWSNRAGQGQVWRMQATGGGPETQITRNGALWSNISRDGKDLY
jgi:Tol biopolymer transport system component/DNA-binding winged helix-turn-helix (wHTH) protein